MRALLGDPESTPETHTALFHHKRDSEGNGKVHVDRLSRFAGLTSVLNGQTYTVTTERATSVAIGHCVQCW